MFLKCEKNAYVYFVEYHIDIEIFMAHIRYRRIELLLKEKNKLILYSGPNSKNIQYHAVA